VIITVSFPESIHKAASEMIASGEVGSFSEFARVAIDIGMVTLQQTCTGCDKPRIGTVNLDQHHLDYLAHYESYGFRSRSEFLRYLMVNLLRLTERSYLIKYPSKRYKKFIWKKFGIRCGMAMDDVETGFGPNPYLLGTPKKVESVESIETPKEAVPVNEVTINFDIQPPATVEKRIINRSCLETKIKGNTLFVNGRPYKLRPAVKGDT